MTNEEAIKRLKEVQAEFNENWVDYGGINEAFEKAYQALEAVLEKPQGERAERAIAIIDRLKTDGHINNKEQGTLRRAILLPERPQGEWIPVTYRPLTAKERIAFAEHYGVEYCDTSEEKAFDCPMPEDGQHILLSRSWGVDIDVADNDVDGEGCICYGLEGNGDWDGVYAWMPMPEPYKKEGES